MVYKQDMDITKNIAQKLIQKLPLIQKELEKENDILLKYDKKKGVVKIYSQKIKKI